VNNLLQRGVVASVFHTKSLRSMDNNSTAKETQGRPIFVAMQGGGARGIVHVAGVIAINDLGLDVRGVAGTSAGSMVAALVAAGYKGRELVDPYDKAHIFSGFPKDSKYKSPQNLFTPGGWRLLRRLRLITGAPKFIFSLLSKKHSLVRRFGHMVALKVTLIAILLSVLSVVSFYYWLFINFPVAAYFSVIASAAGILSLSAYAAHKLQKGLTTVGKVRDFIDYSLRLKLADKLPGKSLTEPIYFSDMAAAGCPPLKIVATNLCKEDLELFCLEKTPDVAVADAVAASICIPVLFSPWEVEVDRIGHELSDPAVNKFVDGGLLSNMPAWPFDEQRLLYPDIPTVTFNLKPDDHVLGNKHWASAMIGAVVNGAQELDTRAAGKIVNLSLPTSLKMLDFHVDEERVYKEVKSPVSAIKDKLIEELHDAPLALRNAAHDIRNLVDMLLEKYKGSLHSGLKSHRLRVAIAVQRGNSMVTLSTVAFSGYERADEDFEITMPMEGLFAGEAWRKRNSSFDSRTEPKGKAPFSAKVHANGKIWNDLEWVFCKPLITKPKEGRKLRPCVVIVDSDIPLSYKQPGGDAELTLFLKDIFELIDVYNDMYCVADFVQGDNTWL
jgi:NTE family protein